MAGKRKGVLSSISPLFSSSNTVQELWFQTVEKIPCGAADSQIPIQIDDVRAPSNLSNGGKFLDFNQD